MSATLPTDDGAAEEPVLVDRVNEPPGEAEADVVTGANPVVADVDPHHDHAHPDYVAHHFDSSEQQFDAGKLGIWLFLVQEVLFFSGLFCAFAVYGSLYPEAFRWGHAQLNPTLGFINTLVLITSSLTMAWAVRCAQLAQRKGLIICLWLTLAGAGGFLVIKTFEYKAKIEHGLIPITIVTPGEPTINFWHPHAGGHHGEHEGEHGDDHAGEHDESHGDAVAGHEGDHADGDDHAEGEHHGGEDHDGEVKPERAVAKGDSAEDDSSGEEKAAPSPTDVVSGAVASAAMAYDPEIARATGREVPIMTPGTAMYAGAAGEYPDASEEVPPMARTFFSIYFAMTGVHAIHILAGIAVIGWLLFRVHRNPGNEFHSDYFGPVDYVGLYWHLVDLVWIYLFPLLYLISWR